MGEFKFLEVVDFSSLMSDFIEWLNNEDILKLYLVEYVVLVYYKFVVIYLFYDGNGRMFRLLMNFILM